MAPAARSAWPRGADCWKSSRSPRRRFGGKAGLGHAPALVRDFDGLACHLEFAPLTDRCLQTLGQGLRESRDVRGFLNAGGSIDVQADGKIECGDRHRFRVFRGVEQSQLSAGMTSTRSTFSFSRRPPFSSSWRPASRLPRGGRHPEPSFAMPACAAPGNTPPNLVGHGLVGPLTLKLSNFRRKTSLTITADAAAEVADEPLQLEVGQLVPGVEVQAERDCSQGRKKREGRRCPALQPSRPRSSRSRRPNNPPSPMAGTGRRRCPSPRALARRLP